MGRGGGRVCLHTFHAGLRTNDVISYLDLSLHEHYIIDTSGWKKHRWSWSSRCRWQGSTPVHTGPHRSTPVHTSPPRSTPAPTGPNGALGTTKTDTLNHVLCPQTGHWQCERNSSQGDRHDNHTTWAGVDQRYFSLRPRNSIGRTFKLKLWGHNVTAVVLPLFPHKQHNHNIVVYFDLWSHLFLLMITWPWHENTHRDITSVWKGKKKSILTCDTSSPETVAKDWTCY